MSVTIGRRWSVSGDVGFAEAQPTIFAEESASAIFFILLLFGSVCWLSVFDFFLYFFPLLSSMVSFFSS